MSDRRFSVNPEGLHNQIPYLQEVTERLRGIGSSLEATLSTLGACWGDDAGGREFLNQYAPSKEKIIKSTADMTEVLHSTGQGIETMAKRFQQLEDENIASVHRLVSPSSPHPSEGGTHPKAKPTKR
ncbi:WXG100 family type VII secretion target [Streptomyces sp. NPDC059649]|uniref:WXG100 family type VII secretion target n=1 Tax=Streptomyces sp. NPDC059649 TaxID=3346895 RepID=UPI00367CAD0F